MHLFQRFVAVFSVFMCLFAQLHGPAVAGGLSASEEIALGGGGGAALPMRPQGGFRLPLNITVTEVREIPEGTAGPEIDGTLRAVVGVMGPLGMVVDYSRGRPRLSGLALSPAENIRLEASGSVDPGFDGVRARVSVHFKF